MARGEGDRHGRSSSRGRCFLYVFPCAWEDHCKLGFSRDPLARIQALHRRWFEFFDIDGGWLVETETVRDARDLELALRRQLVAHNAPMPLTARAQAAGVTEWYRGASGLLAQALVDLRGRGHGVHAPLRSWMQPALATDGERLFAWSLAQLSPDELEGLTGSTPAQRIVRDVLDAYAALAIDLEPLLPPQVLGWYRRR